MERLNGHLSVGQMTRACDKLAMSQERVHGLPVGQFLSKQASKGRLRTAVAAAAAAATATHHCRSWKQVSAHAVAAVAVAAFALGLAVAAALALGLRLHGALAVAAVLPRCASVHFVEQRTARGFVAKVAWFYLHFFYEEV